MQVTWWMPSSFMGFLSSGSAAVSGYAPEHILKRRGTGLRPSLGRAWFAERLRGELEALAGQAALELRERRRLELADALARQAELLADGLERPGLAIGEAEAELDDAALPLGELRDDVPHGLAAKRLRRLLLRVDGGLVGEQVAELAVGVGADCLVERDGRVGDRKGLLRVVEAQVRRLSQLVHGGLAAELELEPLGGPAELLPALVHVHGHADGPRLVRDRALHGLADPPRGVRGELVAAPPVELLDCAVEADDSVLHELEQRHAVTLVAHGDRDVEPEVGVDHALLGYEVATLDSLRERDLLGGRQQLVPADL